jgi:hypothetical protein
MRCAARLWRGSVLVTSLALLLLLPAGSSCERVDSDGHDIGFEDPRDLLSPPAPTSLFAADRWFDVLEAQPPTTFTVVLVTGDNCPFSRAMEPIFLAAVARMCPSGTLRSDALNPAALAAERAAILEAPVYVSFFFFFLFFFLPPSLSSLCRRTHPPNSLCDTRCTKFHQANGNSGEIVRGASSRVLVIEKKPSPPEKKKTRPMNIKFTKNPTLPRSQPQRGRSGARAAAAHPAVPIIVRRPAADDVFGAAPAVHDGAGGPALRLCDARIAGLCDTAHCHPCRRDCGRRDGHVGDHND